MNWREGTHSSSFCRSLRTELIAHEVAEEGGGRRGRTRRVGRRSARVGRAVRELEWPARSPVCECRSRRWGGMSRRATRTRASGVGALCERVRACEVALRAVWKALARQEQPLLWSTWTRRRLSTPRPPCRRRLARSSSRDKPALDCLHPQLRHSLLVVSKQACALVHPAVPASSAPSPSSSSPSHLRPSTAFRSVASLPSRSCEGFALAT